jgi:hypothetical protein
MKWVAIALLASTPARADTLLESLHRHDEADVTRLRALLPDASARCALGVTYIFRDDLTRAALYLEGCASARIAPEIAGWVRLAVPALDDRLRMSELAKLEVRTKPGGLLVTIDTVPDETFPTPATIWLPEGTHELRAGEASVVVTVGAREEVAVHLAADPASHPPRIDPRVTVMRQNDCAHYLKRHPGAACLLWMNDDLDPPYPWTLPRVYRLHRYDPLTMILQSAEEL